MIAGLTILVVPADRDLLADECGGRVPTLTWCYNTITDENRWARPGPGMRPHEGAHAAVGLVLVFDGVPVAMGCDRMLHVLAPLLLAEDPDGDKAEGESPGEVWWIDSGGDDRHGNPLPARLYVGVRGGWFWCFDLDIEPGEECDLTDEAKVLHFARFGAGKLGARVVLLRDGREVDHA